MRALTPAQVDALTRSFGPEPIVTAQRASGGPVHTLPVIAGEIEWTAASTERTTVRRLVVPAVDTDGTVWLPESWDSPLVPDDVVLTVHYGIGIGPPVTLATVWLDDVTVSRPDGLVECTAYSRATRIRQAGFPAGERRYSGPTVDVIGRIASDALGHTVPVLDLGVPQLDVLPQTVFDGDPWQAIEDLADAAGAEAFFDDTDRLVYRPQPEIGTPATTLAVGDAGTITGYRISLTRAPNVVRMEFQHPAGGRDVVGTAQATGHADPAGRYGPFRVTETRTGAVTPAQALAAARAFLTRAGGMLRAVEIDAAPHPGIQIGDTIGVQLVTGETELHRVIGVRLGLATGDGMTITTRSTPW